VAINELTVKEIQEVSGAWDYELTWDHLPPSKLVPDPASSRFGGMTYDHLPPSRLVPDPGYYAIPIWC
jgi:hypothetical protein